MKANILIFKDYFRKDGEFDTLEVEVLEVFTFRSFNFFVHHTPYSENYSVSHFETGYRVKEFEYSESLTLESIIEKVKSKMSEIEYDKFCITIRKKIKECVINKKEPLKINLETKD